MEGGREERKAFAKAKAERASGASLILPNMGCTRQVFWRHLGGLYPVFSLFLTYCFSDLSVFLFNYILCFFLPLFIFYILQISSSSSVLDPLLSHWVPTSELPLDKDQNLLHIPLHPCHKIG